MTSLRHLFAHRDERQSFLLHFQFSTAHYPFSRSRDLKVYNLTGSDSLLISYITRPPKKQITTMDPTTAAHTSQPLHHSHLQTGVDSTGMPTLNTGAPYAGVGSQTSPGAPLTSSPSVGTSNLAAPKSSAPAADPIAGLSAPAPANSNQSPSTTTDKLNTTAANAKDSALNAKDKAADQASAAATGIRKRLNSISSSVEGAADHPTVKNVKVEAEKQVQGLREQLGRFPIVVEAEKKTGVDRVALVIGGVLLYVPFTLSGQRSQEEQC